jgi:outer membrane protein OmpA-like peptidoglycan-associated protein
MARRGFSLVLAFALPLACGVAQAADPSVDDILSALKPKAGNLNGTTRGIRAMAPEPDAPAATPHTHRIAMVRATQDAAPATEAPSLDLTIGFRSGSTDLTPAAEGTLSKLGKALSNPSLAAYRFRIEGHTDTVGTKEENQTLSQARAEKVASYLEQEFGVAADRLQPVGLGEEGLLVPTPDQTAEARNRRVHVVNLGP